MDLPVSSAILSHASEIMSTVDHQVRIVFLAYFLSLDQIRCIRVHGEQTLSDDQNTIIWIFFSSFFQGLHHGIMVQVRELDDIGSGSIGSLL